jgi:hypothetical protein
VRLNSRNFLVVVPGGERLSPLVTSATVRPIVSPPDDG